YPRLRAASSVTTDLEDVAERVRLRHHVVDAVRDTGYLKVLAGDVPGVDVAPSNRDPHRHPRRRWKPRRQVAVREPVGPAVEVRGAEARDAHIGQAEALLVRDAERRSGRPVGID